MWNLISEVSRVTDKLIREKKHNIFNKNYNKLNPQSKLQDFIRQTNNRTRKDQTREKN